MVHHQGTDATMNAGVHSFKDVKVALTQADIHLKSSLVLLLCECLKADERVLLQSEQKPESVLDLLEENGFPYDCIRKGAGFSTAIWARPE